MPAGESERLDALQPCKAANQPTEGSTDMHTDNQPTDHNPSTDRLSPRLAVVAVTVAVLVFLGGLLMSPDAAHADPYRTDQVNQPHVRPHRPCPQEDSHWCVWDARHMGNGVGHSFWSGRGGRIHYVSHRVAHQLIHRH